MRVLYALLLVALSASAASAVGICFVPSPNGTNGTVDCSFPNPTLWPNAYTGFSNDAPCRDGFCGLAPKSETTGFQEYEWSISSSQFDPYQNSAPLPVGIVDLYLWLRCSIPDGWVAAEFSLVTDDPSFLLIALTPQNGVLNAGTTQDPLLAVGGCPSADFLVAHLLCLYTGPVSTESETWGGIKALYR